jgi:hypothetical protein
LNFVIILSSLSICNIEKRPKRAKAKNKYEYI